MNATDQQLRYIRDLCEQTETPDIEMLDEYAPGVECLEDLTVAQASQIINELKALLH